MYIADIETNGLNPDIIHCAVFYNIDTKDLQVFTPDNMDKLKPFLETVQGLCMHNGIGFDLKVFRKLLGFDYQGSYCDTLLMAQILWPDIRPAKYKDEFGKECSTKGRHSLEAWGVRLGVKKPEHEDWDNYSEDMLRRCKEDVKITIKLFQRIKEEVVNRDFQRYKEVFALEHSVWKIIEQQADHGWVFDKGIAITRVGLLSDAIEKIEKSLHDLLPNRVIRPYKDTVCKAFKKDGSITKNALTWTQNRFKEVAGDFCRVQFEKVDINSATQLKEFMLEKGWKPSEYNYKKDIHGKPLKVNGKPVQLSPKLPTDVEEWNQVAAKLKMPEIATVAEYKKCQHRRSQIQGLIENVRPDGRIEAQASTCMTNTARMTHRKVVNIPKAEEGVFYGKEMRSLFRVPDSKVLVGFDASALEARVMAHYVHGYDEKLSKELIEGDIHSQNAEFFGITRHEAKGAFYGIMYGASPFKFASLIGAPQNKAKELYQQFWDKNYGLKMVKEDLESEFQRSGYITSVDGRPLTVRYKHALINTLFQSAGSIAMKKTLVILDQVIKKRNLDAQFVGNFHDEFQIECSPADAEQVGKYAEKCIQKAGHSLGFLVPLEGEYKIGSSWSDTH